MEIKYRTPNIMNVFRYGRTNGFTVIEMSVFNKSPIGETIGTEPDTWVRVATAVPLADTTGVTSGYLDLPISPGNEEIDRATFEADILAIDASENAAGRPGYLDSTNRELQRMGVDPIVAP